MGQVIVKSSQFLPGAPMEHWPGVRDIKCIYPETGCDNRTLVMGIVEVESESKTPLHRHNCEEVYYVLDGSGEVEIEGTRHPFKAGDAVYLRENAPHRVLNTAANAIRLLVVAGPMFVGLLPRWPTESPYEIMEDERGSVPFLSNIQ